MVCGIQDNARIGRALNVLVTHAHGLHSIEVQVPSKLHLGQCSRISRGRDNYVTQILEMDETDLHSVNKPFPIERHSPPEGDLLATRLVSPPMPVKAPPPTSRSDTSHLGRVSLESAQRVQVDLV